MDHRPLGRSGLKVPRFSLGSWLTFGTAVDEDATRACVKLALDAGITMFETADAYGRGGAERMLGKCLAGQRRQDLVLASKAFWPMSDNPNDRGLSRKHLTESLHGSLERLGTDYLDLYQCHRADPETPIEETVRAMGDFIRQGRVLYWGVSFWSAEQISEACRVADRLLLPRPISNQPPYSLVQRGVERDVVPTCQREGLGQIVFSPLAQGILTGKYASGIPAGTRAADERLGVSVRSILQADVVQGVERLRPIASGLGISMAQLALAWVRDRPGVDSVILGARTPEQLRENLGASDVTLSSDVCAAIERALPAGNGPG